jgi:hypothetical protein
MKTQSFTAWLRGIDKRRIAIMQEAKQEQTHARALILMKDFLDHAPKD